MRIPPFMLAQSVEVEVYQGAGAYGPSYAPATTKKCRVESRKRVAVTAQGNDVTIEATLFFDPDEVIPEESKVVLDGKAMKVVSSRTHYDLIEGQYLEVMCA